MYTRRAFLTALAGAGIGGPMLGDTRDTLPDGHAAKDMITPKAQLAIDRGLDYLVKVQRADGHLGTGQYDGNVAITSLAGLALMSGGHQPGRGPYGRAVTKAVQYVLAQEEPGRPGYLHNRWASPHGPMYGHGFGTLFLAEVHGMVHDRDLRQRVRDTLKRAVELIENSQNRWGTSKGGWRYVPGSLEADLSVTICQIMALRAARNAGIDVRKDVVDRCIEYVKSCRDRDTGGFKYMPSGRVGGAGFARTAAGVAALYSAGIYEGPEIDRALQYMRTYRSGAGQQHIWLGRGPDLYYFYGHYYAVQVMWTKGGTYWAEWYPAIREELIGRQRQDGCWQDSICNHYGTAMACIILQVPNNYLPILQK